MREMLKKQNQKFVSGVLNKQTELLCKYYIHFVLQIVVTYEFVLLCLCTLLPAESCSSGCGIGYCYWLT